MPMTPVEPGMLATVVTFLEMTQRPKPAPVAASPLRLNRWKAPEPDKYRALFRRIGEPWLWFSRLVMTNEALTAIIHDPAVDIFAICDNQGIEVGLLELDFRTEGQCTIAFCGLIPQLTGKGLGRWLMGQAMMMGWRKGVEKIAVQTCTLDHPAALSFYRRAGFQPIRRSIETFPDPRLIGICNKGAAPHIPLLDCD